MSGGGRAAAHVSSAASLSVNRSATLPSTAVLRPAAGSHASPLDPAPAGPSQFRSNSYVHTLGASGVRMAYTFPTGQWIVVSGVIGVATFARLLPEPAVAVAPSPALLMHGSFA